MSAKHNILIIAFYFSPDKRVGALRATYWYKNLGSKMNCNVKVLTANSDANAENVHFVPVSGRSILSRFIKDEGLLWRDNLKSFLENQTNFIPDTVIMTGGPFMHFGITKWLKTKYKCKVILDFRDPFAVNPRFNNNSLVVFVKRYFERKFNRNADALITVNHYCSEIIELFNKKRNQIVQNGFDENVKVELVQPNFLNGINFVYTGKLYFETDTFFRAIESTNHTLDYCGSDGDQVNKEVFTNHGLVSYEKALEIVSNSDVGLIQTEGDDHLSTTKIFDYIRCKRPIFIISNKYIKRGSIHEELKGYSNVFWAENNETDIKRAILEISNHEYIEPSDELINKYSRGKQMEKLVKLIQELHETV